MCGLAGVLSFSDGSYNSLNKILDLLKHRGPDDQGTYYDQKITLGHTRLSILDLSPLGHQPMSYAAERYWIIFNGEIYNYLELRDVLQTKGHQFRSQTDTEIILAAYAEWGVACLDKLRGMFAFALWDKENKRLFLARDRTGEKPLYYWHDDKNFYFASELKTLIKLLPEQPALDPASIDLYFHYQYVPEPRTPFKNVCKLHAAHYLLIDSNNWEITPKLYWSFDQIESVQGNPDELIRAELEHTIELTLRSDVPVGVALSGGLDSSAIAALAATRNGNLQAFSVGYPGRPEYDERKQAEYLSRNLGLPFHDVELNTEELVKFFPSLVATMDDPIADIAAYGHYSVSKLAADHGVKVMLSGLGGDELFWGYSWVSQAAQLSIQKQRLLKSPLPLTALFWIGALSEKNIYQRLTNNQKIPSPIRKLLHYGTKLKKMTLNHPDQAVFQDLVPDFQTAIPVCEQIYTNEFRSQLSDRNAFTPFIMDIENIKDIPLNIQKTLFETWLVSNCLSLGDRVSMASSIETRTPFLDYKLIELVIGLSKQTPQYNLKQKAWLKSALKGTLPDTILNRPKRGFQPPVQEWINALIKHYREQLMESILVRNFIVSKKELEIMLMDVPRYNFMLYKFIVLELWYKKVMVEV